MVEIDSETKIKENSPKKAAKIESANDDLGEENEESTSNTATTSVRNSSSCGKNECVPKNKSYITSHEELSHVWECEFCDAVEFDEYDLEDHINEKHEFKCEFCEFEAIQGVAFDKHMLEKHTVCRHPYTCETCKLTCRTRDKVFLHICKADVTNPTFDTLYTKSWYNKNGCNPVYCTHHNRDVAWLHAEKCWVKDISCFGPFTMAKTLVKHFKTEEIIKEGIISWTTISEETRNLVYSDN